MFHFPEEQMGRLTAAIRRLLEGRTGSICPSEAARAVGGEDWRPLMEPAREAARILARAGEVEITRKGEVLDPDGIWRGPIRVRRRPPGVSDRCS